MKFGYLLAIAALSLASCLFHGVEAKKVNADLVSFTLYYESLCPGCRALTTTQIWKAYQSVSSIMNLTLVPYGNAQVCPPKYSL